jgi:hypothetical protein
LLPFRQEPFHTGFFLSFFAFFGDAQALIALVAFL